TQTNYPWDSWQKKYDAEPKVWFHDIFRPDGKPYDPKEVETIKGVTDVRFELELRFSVKELDPLKPGDAYLECTVHNRSSKPILAPTVYTGGYESDIVLATEHRFGLHLVHWAGPKKQDPKPVPPGETITVFKADLNSLFLLGVDKQKPLKPNE